MDTLRIKKDGWWVFSPYIRSREEFKTHGSMYGTESPEWRWGRLPVEYRDSVKRATYAVMSYSTPIAWYSEEDGWTVPDVKYSATTSVHQGKVRASLINTDYKE